MIDNIKSYMLFYIIGKIGLPEFIALVDSYIKEDEWIDEFEFLSSPSYYQKGELINLLKYGSLSITAEEIFKFEATLFYGYLETLEYDPLKWKTIQPQLVKYFDLKKDLFELSSNDMPVEWLTLIDDFELRSDGYSGLVDMPGFLILLLKRNWTQIPG